MNANSTASVRVECGGDQVVAHVGLHALGGLADRLGLGNALSARVVATGEGYRLHDRGKVLVQASALLYVAMARIATLDMSLSATLQLTMSALVMLVARRETSSVWPWPLLLGIGVALAVLTKGLVAAAIPAAVLILYSLYSRDATPWRRLYAQWGLPLFLAITVPWHWLAARRLPDFLEFFFVHEHVARYLTPIADRQEPWWFFGGVFLAGSVPWTLSALRVLGGGWRRHVSPAAFNPTLFLWIWVVFIGVFFSLSDSKLMPYILPLMPALALLIAALPAQALERDFLFTAILTLIAGCGLGLASLNWASVIASSDRSAYFLPLAKPVGQIALLLSVSGAFVLVQRGRGVTRAGVFLGAGWCLAWLLVIRAAASVAPLYSGVGLAAAVLGNDRAAPIYSVGTYDQTLTFYLRRTVTLVGYRGELDYGLRKAPGAEIADVAEFLRRWSAPAQAFAVMEKTMFDDLKDRGVPMRLVAQNAKRVLVARQ